MAKYRLILETNNAEAIMGAFVQAQTAGASPRIEMICPDCNCQLGTNVDNCETCSSAAIVLKSGGSIEFGK